MNRYEASDFWRAAWQRHRDKGYQQWEAGRLAALDLYDVERSVPGRVEEERDQLKRLVEALAVVPVRFESRRVDKLAVEARTLLAALSASHAAQPEPCGDCDGRGHYTVWPHTTCPTCAGSGVAAVDEGGEEA